MKQKIYIKKARTLTMDSGFLCFLMKMPEKGHFFM